MRSVRFISQCYEDVLVPCPGPAHSIFFTLAAEAQVFSSAGLLLCVHMCVHILTSTTCMYSYPSLHQSPLSNNTLTEPCVCVDCLSFSTSLRAPGQKGPYLSCSPLHHQQVGQSYQMAWYQQVLNRLSIHEDLCQHGVGDRKGLPETQLNRENWSLGEGRQRSQLVLQ